MRLRALLAVFAAAAGLMLAAPAADAAGTLAYPPTICATISVSTTNPLPGQQIIVTGTNFTPNADVKLELHAVGGGKVYPLQTVKADAAGSFHATITLPPGVTGHFDIVAVTGAPGGAGCPADPFQELNIQAGGAGASSTSSAGAGGAGGNGGGTAFTGLDILAMVVGAAALLTAGVLFNRGGKRRRRDVIIP